MDLRQGHVRFFGKFAHFYDAGVPLAEALEIASRELPAPLRDAIDGVIGEIFRGSALADALARRKDLFGPEIVSILRSGESRGELGTAARSVAAGLSGRVLDPVAAPDAEVDRILAHGGILHASPQGAVRRREGDLFPEVDRAETPALAAALARRAGLGMGAGEGSFLWEDRLVRVSILETPEGPSVVAKVSGNPPAPPPVAALWRDGPPALLVVAGGRRDDKDAMLRSILRASPGLAIAVDLPVPEATPAPDVASALAHDPDLLCAARLDRLGVAHELAEAVLRGVHCLAGLDAPTRAAAEARIRSFGLPPIRLHLC